MIREIKMLHVISSLARGGRERQLSTIISNIDKQRFPCKIVYFNDTPKSFIDEYHLEEKLIKIQSQNSIVRFFELNKIIKSYQPDVIYSWGNFESIYVLVLNLFNQSIFVNGSIRHGIRLKKISHLLRTLILHLSKNIIANSKAGLKVNNLSRGYVLYNGIQDKFTEKIGPDVISKKKKEITGNDNDNLIMISVANLVPYKDYFSILSALKEIKRINNDFVYLILGDGPLKNDIENKINEYHLENNVRILGSVENVETYLQVSDIFIHSSKGEGCSNAILEAMAAGLPVVASNTGGTSEIVTEQNGRLFDYKDDKGLAGILKYLIANREQMEAMGKNSYQLVLDLYTVKKMITNFERIIREIQNHA